MPWKKEIRREGQERRAKTDTMAIRIWWLADGIRGGVVGAWVRGLVQGCSGRRPRRRSENRSERPQPLARRRVRHKACLRPSRDASCLVGHALAGLLVSLSRSVSILASVNPNATLTVLEGTGPHPSDRPLVMSCSAAITSAEMTRPERAHCNVRPLGRGG